MSVRRRRAIAVAATLVGVGGILVATQPADAASISSGAAAYSAAANNGSAVLSPTLEISTSLNGIVDSQINTAKKNDLDPLVAALHAANNTLVLSALGAGSTLTAKTDGSQTQSGTAPAAFPTDPLPSPCTASDPIAPCYSNAVTTTIDDSPLVTAQVGNVGGYVEQVASGADPSSPIFGRAGVASATVSVLPNLTSLTHPLVVSATGIDAKATCPNDLTAGATQPTTPPSASGNANSVSVLGGLVTFAVADGNITNVVVNGTSYPDVVTMPTTTVGDVTISPYGYSLSVSIPLTVAQVVENVGLPASAVADLEGFTPTTSTVTLRLIVGPKAALTATTAVARGLAIGVDLSGTLEFNINDLATADVHIPSGLSSADNGNLLDLRLAYANCVSSTAPAAGTPAIPPALV